MWIFSPLRQQPNDRKGLPPSHSRGKLGFVTAGIWTSHWMKVLEEAKAHILPEIFRRHVLSLEIPHGMLMVPYLKLFLGEIYPVTKNSSFDLNNLCQQD